MAFRLELKGQVLPQDADPQELKGLLGNFHLLNRYLLASIIPADHLGPGLCLLGIDLEYYLQHKRVLYLQHPVWSSDSSNGARWLQAFACSELM